MGGKVTCTLGEVKQRADFIIYWGGNPAECHPRHFTKYTLMQKSKFLSRGRKDRTMVLVDIRETKSVRASDIFLQVRPGKDFELITILRALVKEQPVTDVQIAETGITREVLDDLVARIASFPAAAIAEAKAAVLASEPDPVPGMLEEGQRFNRLLSDPEAIARMERFLALGGQTREFERDLTSLLDRL